MVTPIAIPQSGRTGAGSGLPAVGGQAAWSWLTVGRLAGYGQLRHEIDPAAGTPLIQTTRLSAGSGRDT